MDQIITTSEKKATIYDTLTGEVKNELFDPKSTPNVRFSDRPLKNIVASFNPYDDLIISDRTLWDPRIPPKIIHRVCYIFLLISNF